MNFREYLVSKKIDSDAFRIQDPDLWESWRLEYESISPASFTAQKLFLINPVRRKYHLTIVETPTTDGPNVQKPAVETPQQTQVTDSNNTNNPTVVEEKKVTSVKPMVPRPIFKPKPKTTE